MVRIKWLSWFLLLSFACVITFLAGIYIERSSMFPSIMLQDVYKTVVVNLRLWEEEDEAGGGGSQRWLDFSNSVRTFNIARLGDDPIVVFDFADTFPGQGGWLALRQMAGRAGTASFHRQYAVQHWKRA